MNASIDSLPTEKSLLDLGGLNKGTFNSVFEDFVLTKVLDDVILVEFVDENEDGNAVKRGAIFVPINVDTSAWRKGKVLMIGPRVKYVELGDVVCFPNNMGVPVANLEIQEPGAKETRKMKRCMFINEQRIFGVCKEKEKPNANG